MPLKQFTLSQLLNPLNERTLIQGILNITPDSFSDGGTFQRVDVAVAHAIQMVSDGADWIDIGGESTRPGAAAVSLDEELSRVIPVIEAVRKEVDVPISIDTYKAEVARQALEVGANIINDVWSLQRDPDMVNVAIAAGCPVIFNHNRINPMPVGKNVEDVVIADLIAYTQDAISKGLDPRQIITDPGIGFGHKSTQDNLRLMNYLNELVKLGYPVLLGTSRKKFIRETLNRPALEVLEGTASTIVSGIFQGCTIVRVHDVLEIKRTVMMCDAIRKARGK